MSSDFCIYISNTHTTDSLLSTIMCGLNMHEIFHYFIQYMCYLSLRAAPLQYVYGQFPQKQALLQGGPQLVYSVECQAQWM